MRGLLFPKTVVIVGARWVTGFFLASAVAMAADSVVPTAAAQYRDVDQAYVTDAVVEAVHQSTVAAQISGRIVEINFDVGDYVQKGQVIMRIDSRELTQQVAGSQAQLAREQANLSNARAQYERTKQLHEQKFVSQAALDKALAEYNSAQAQMRATLAGVGAAETTKGFATIVAPYSGVVAARHVELGEMAAPGKPLMTGFDPRDMRVVANVPQYRVAAVRAASSATIEIPSIKKSIKASAVTVLPSADEKTLTTRVRLDLPEGARDVYPGVFARAHFVVGSARKLVISESAVLRRSELTAVYVVDDKGAIQLRQVRLGVPTGDGQVEVLAGLATGERVATDPVKAGITVAPSVPR